MKSGVLTEISSESDGVLTAVGSGGGGGSDFPRLRLFPCRLTLVHSEEGEGGGIDRRGVNCSLLYATCWGKFQGKNLRSEVIDPRGQTPIYTHCKALRFCTI